MNSKFTKNLIHRGETGQVNYTCLSFNLVTFFPIIYKAGCKISSTFIQEMDYDTDIYSIDFFAEEYYRMVLLL